jgi:SAM-dependent methyltransferase
VKQIISHVKPLQKLTYEINKALSRYFYSDFQFHPATKHLETNPELGVGNGHALSRDLQYLVPFLILLRILNCKSFLDLGSGDGYVLRCAEKLRFSQTFGVEADYELFEISTLNLSHSTLYQIYFEEISSRSFPQCFDVVYLFNPDKYETTKKTLMFLKSRYWLMKNFSLSEQDEHSLGVVNVLSINSYTLYKTKKP